MNLKVCRDYYVADYVLTRLPGRKKNTETTARCRKCGRPLLLSELDDYTYQCLFCDEDFYSIEAKNGKLPSKEEVEELINQVRHSYSDIFDVPDPDKYECSEEGLKKFISDALDFYEPAASVKRYPSLPFELNNLPLKPKGQITFSYGYCEVIKNFNLSDFVADSSYAKTYRLKVEAVKKSLSGPYKKGTVCAMIHILSIISRIQQ